jgi:uncharacterized repeat protein (TIGR03803 family)
VQGIDGNLYGTTYGGGEGKGAGTVFKITTNGAVTTLYSFDPRRWTGELNGGSPVAGLVQGSDGNFYGTTYGLVNGFDTPGYPGTVFQISTNGALTTLYDFPVYNYGGSPSAGLVQGSDGSFYGTTAAGTVFRLTVVPPFLAVTLTNGLLSLTWTPDTLGTYQLQYSSDLSSSNWINLGGPVAATGATLSATDAVTNDPRRFYRLVLLP